MKEEKTYEFNNIAPSMVSDFQASYGVNNRDMAGLLKISDKTYYNIMQKDKLSPVQADRLMSIQKIYKEGAHVFMDEESFSKWLDTKQYAFNNQKPKELLGTITGMFEVMDQLGRIKHGILA
jgi:putative toxin-antitoxin system antitoxin component (TIGR02293 family)